MRECINGYTLTEDWHISGAAQWSYAEKDGKQWFIKRFLSPKYKVAGKGISLESVRKAYEYCEKFRKKQERYYAQISRADTGNIVCVAEFFSYETSFYAVSPRIMIEEMPMEEVAKLPYEKKLVLMKVLAYSLERLHSNGVVHADLKPSNIILKKTETGSITLKLIDFEAGFLKESPRKGKEIMFDQVYVAPETLLALDDTSIAIDEKIDVFALGLLFHQFFTGKYPVLTGECEVAAEALLCEDKIQLESWMPFWLEELIQWMLQLEPKKRPSTAEVLRCLQEERGSLLWYIPKL